MSDALLAIAPGPYVTIQDSGRLGWRRFGVSRAGAMDVVALHLANALAGNPPDTAALEFAHVGGTWEIAAASCRIAITGGDFAISSGGVALASWRSHTLKRGQRLTIEGTRDAVWGYLAVAGGFRIAPHLGSVATHLGSELGGMNGRRVAEGDALPLSASRAPSGPERRVMPLRHELGPMRVVLGPQQDFFTPETIEAFLAASYRMTHRADRMGAWLDGPKIAHARGFNVLSDGLVPGCIQVPGAGQPVVLLMDCQTLGGYPKLATIVTSDLPRFVQTRPGSHVTFAAVDIEGAHRLYREHRLYLAGLERSVHNVTQPPSRSRW
jgi:5-oxoprolinase (ATP-hydrolysing) subunit C